MSSGAAMLAGHVTGASCDQQPGGLTSAGAVVGVQQVAVATGAVEATDVVVTEVVAQQLVVRLLVALVHVWTEERERE